MHPDTEHIVALHTSDVRCESLQKEITVLQEAVAAATQKLVEAKSLAAKERAALGELQEREESCTKRYERYLDKAENTRRLMESGQVSNYDAAQTQLRQCLSIADAEETALLELMEAIEATTTQIAARDDQVALREDQRQNKIEALDEQLPGLETALAEARLTREERSLLLRDDHLSLYEQLRKKLRHAVSVIHEDACGSCGMVVSSMPLAEHRRGSAVHRCRNCGRFLGPFL